MAVRGWRLARVPAERARERAHAVEPDGGGDVRDRAVGLDEERHRAQQPALEQIATPLHTRRGTELPTQRALGHTPRATDVLRAHVGKVSVREVHRCRYERVVAGWEAQWRLVIEPVGHEIRER